MLSYGAQHYLLSMGTASRSLVLNTYKSLHRTILRVFEGDKDTIQAAKVKAKEEFRKNANETDSGKIDDLLKVAKDVEKVLQKQVVQAVKNETGTYQLKLKPDHLQKNAVTCEKIKEPDTTQ